VDHAADPTQDVLSSIAVDPALRAELPTSIQRSGTLVLATTDRPGTVGLPIAGTAPGGADIGVEADIRDAVARLLGISWKVENSSFDTIILGVQNGKFDVGQDDFAVTKAREQVVDFAPYLSDGQAFVSASDSSLNAVHSITDLCGLTIATLPGSTFQQILSDDASKCAAAGKAAYTVSLFSDTTPIWLGLANGKVDVYFGPELSLRYDVTHLPNVKFLGDFGSTPVGFVASRGTGLAKSLSDAINKLVADGDYAKILAKWSIGSSGIAHSEVNPPTSL
jgi:polar amino acid transport system substrate-binding protein